jgi:hypothetical protein
MLTKFECRGIISKDNVLEDFMKKFILFALFVAIVAPYGFSQIFLGGGLSYQHRSSKISNNSTDSNT